MAKHRLKIVPDCAIDDRWAGHAGVMIAFKCVKCSRGLLTFGDRQMVVDLLTKGSRMLIGTAWGSWPDCSEDRVRVPPPTPDWVSRLRR